MKENKSVKRLVDDNATRHDLTRHCEVASHFTHWVLHNSTCHCEEGKRSAARRGNLRRALTCSCKFTAFTQLYPQLCKQGHKARKLACSLCFHIGRGKSSVFPLQAESVRVCHNNSGSSQSLISSSNHPTHFTHFKKAAFTLAEVLITLGVIGVVAAMTIPTLISNYQEKVTVTKLKKVYSVLNQAYSMAIQENGDPTQWGLSNATSVGGSPDDEDYEEKLSEYFKNATKPLTYILPYLKTDLVDNVIDYPRFSMDGTEFGYFKRYAVLPDGVYIVLSTVISSNCSQNFGNNLLLNNVCGEIGVDLNGINPPNATGKDVFLFYYTKYGIIPVGSKLQAGLRTFASDCNLSQKSNLNGYGCTAWVIENGNMDYLHCDDLSWDGKHKCSD